MALIIPLWGNLFLNHFYSKGGLKILLLNIVLREHP